MKRIFIFCIMLNLLFACTQAPTHPELTDGVSQELAQWRKSNIEGLKYNLRFDIPAELNEKINAHAMISFTCDNRILPELDFKAPAESIKSVKVNNGSCEWKFEKEHIIINKESAVNKNERHDWIIEIDFTAPDMSLNRRADYLYTLLVPDRARTLFPCFDQPDLKANYTLELNIPEDWTAVSNTSIKESEKGHFIFNESEPLSTYLFSFVAGKFEKETAEKDGRTISMYHRENDPDKLAQIPEIFNEVFEAIDWQENYTGMKFPFEKYDFIVIPGFQFGGMEHTGATLYNERLFLSKGAGLKEQMSRFSLIAHETTHMWFGDCVTMKWFNEVWTKEVFANFFAGKMLAEKYKETSPGLTYTKYARAAYAEDRTVGATPINQKLDNLKNAGLIYSNIVYNKSPLVMNMLEERMGKKNFQKGIRKYLQTFAYGNADWNDLIGILDNETEEDLKKWSSDWVEKAGMPTITSKITTEGDETFLNISQEDHRNPGIFRQQKIQYTILYKNGLVIERNVDLEDSTARINLGKEPVIAFFPNTDAKAYGYFKIDSVNIVYNALLKELDMNNPSKVWKLSVTDKLENKKSDDESSFVIRNGRNQFQSRQLANNHNLNNMLNETFVSSTLINLYENFMHETPVMVLKMGITQNRKDYGRFLIRFLKQEKNPILFSQAAGNLLEVQKYLEMPEFDDAMLDIIESSLPEKCRRYALSALTSGMIKEETENLLYKYFMNPSSFKAFNLSEDELTSMSYELAIRLPGKSGQIVKLQRSRIGNPDRLEEYNFISRAVTPVQEDRDSLFYSFLKAENRTIEPWTAYTISLLCHKKYHRKAIDYILPGLEELEEIQMTGDIFFTKSWINALLSSYIVKAREIFISKFLYQNPDYPPMLKNKILLMINSK